MIIRVRKPIRDRHEILRYDANDDDDVTRDIGKATTKPPYEKKTKNTHTQTRTVNITKTSHQQDHHILSQASTKNVLLP